MSKVAIEGNAAGTGTFTIAAPNSNTSRTLTLPDATGTVAITSDIPSNSFVFLSSTNLNNNATADFTLPSGYDAYMFVLGNVIPVNDNVSFYLRTSANGGSSFDAGASDYTDTVTISSGDASFITLAVQTGSAAGEGGVSGTVTVCFPAITQTTNLVGFTSSTDSSNQVRSRTVAGRRNAAAAVDAIRFLFASGNIESGTINLYGIKNA